MQQYLDLLDDILTNGKKRMDRTGTGTIGVFGRQLRFNLAEGFPLVTTKKTFYKGIIAELLWFLEGSTNNNRLHELGAKIWDDWATEDGQLGPIYGKQWRSWRGKVLGMKNVDPVRRDEKQMHFTGEPIYDEIDQIKELIENLKNKPFSRRHIISAWNPTDLPDESISPKANVINGQMALAPCHCLFQFYVSEMDSITRYFNSKHTFNRDNLSSEEIHKKLDELNVPKYKLDCQLYQRSVDTPLGVPFNIASYALLTMMIAQCVDMIPGEFIHTFGDVHIYFNQVNGVKEQLTREPRRLPKMIINPEKKDIFSFTMDDFKLEGYDPHPGIDYPISI